MRILASKKALNKMYQEALQGEYNKEIALIRARAELERAREAAFVVIGDSEDWQCDCAVCDAVRAAFNDARAHQGR